MEVVRANESHVYLGNALPGDLTKRGRKILNNRLRCAWAKFNIFRKALTDKHVNLRLRLKLFDSVVTPSAVYGLSVAPLTTTDLELLAISRRKMLRSMVGFVKHADDSWADMYRCLRERLDAALTATRVRDWNEEVKLAKEKLKMGVATSTASSLTARAVNWHPPAVVDTKLEHLPHRSRGRPFTRWTGESSEGGRACRLADKPQHLCHM